MNFKPLILIIGFLTSPFVIASETSCCKKSFSYVAALTGGVVWSPDMGGSADFQTGFTRFTYEPEEGNQTQGVYGGFLGGEWRMSPAWDLQLGLGYYQTSTFNTEGTLTQGVSAPSYNAFNYTYDVISRQLLAEGKVLMNWAKRYHPYISVGLGVAFNTAQDYKVDIGPPLTFSPAYDDHTERSFTYSIGLGMDYDITHYLRFGIGYRFADLGKTELGDGQVGAPGSYVAVPEAPSQRHFYSQEILAQLTWLM